MSLLFLLCLFVTSFKLDVTLAQTERSYLRFREFPIGSNKSVFVDLKESPNYELLDRLAKSSDLNLYLLYTRQNPDSAQYIRADDLASIQSLNYNPQVPTVVLIHGWKSSPRQEFDVSVRKALLQTEDVNVIVVDWRTISSLGYVTAVLGVPLVGKDVGHLLEYLNGTLRAPLTKMHLVGHSLGAHVAANAGRKTGGRVRRITGLDPAGPLWYINPYRLKPEDAMYVEAIHTNGLVFGIGEEVADADFFPNGGSLQPGCNTTNCNHARSYQLFAASIRYNKFVGKECLGFIQMTLDLCRGDRLLMGNNDLNKFGKGIFRLDSTGSYPYLTTTTN